MSNATQIIIDSDALIGLMHETDELHERATAIYQEIKAQQMGVSTTSAVVTEVITLLSHRRGQEAARKFLDDYINSGQLPVIFIHETYYQHGLLLFYKETKKRSSFTDCVNAVVCQKLQMSHIFSFDKVYPKSFDIDLIASTENGEK